jgi:hypothetical protein
MQAFSSFLARMRQRQVASKLFIAAMHDNTMRDRWVTDEEWMRHICAYGNNIGIQYLNMGLSQRCDWCNNQFILDGYLLLHNVKAIHHQKKGPKKAKKMRFYYVVSVGQLAPTIPSIQQFYQDLWNDRKMSKRFLKQTAQDDCSKQEQPSKKQARQQPPRPISPTSALDLPSTSLICRPRLHSTRRHILLKHSNVHSACWFLRGKRRTIL